MSKHVFAVGFSVPGEVVESVGYDSDSSLLDADLIIFSPNLAGYRAGENYQGKPCLQDDDSARLQSDAAHWQRELRIALEAGKTVFVILSGSGDVYVHTGRTEYSGTGRNARASRIVTRFDPYSSIPVAGLDFTIRRSTGQRIKTTKDVGLLASYWQEFGSATSYEVYLDKNIGIPALVTQTGDKMVGGVIRFKEMSGTVVLLPIPDLLYMADEREEQLADKQEPSTQSGIEEIDESDVQDDEPSEADRSVGNQFISALVEIDKILRAKAERTPAPLWANADEYALKEETEFRNQMSEMESRIAELQEQKTKAERNLEAAGNLRGLMFETGKPLESAILEALRTIGFAAEGFVDNESEFDAIFTDSSGIRLLGEAEGKNDRAINIDKLSQLERNLQEDFEKRPDSMVYAKGVLFGNAFRLLPPAERGDYFTPKCVAGAKRLGVALVRTPDLFSVARFLKENPSPELGDACRKAILETNGEVVMFPLLPQVESAESCGSPSVL